MKYLPYLLVCVGFNLLALSALPGVHLADNKPTSGEAFAFSGSQELGRSSSEGVIFPSEANKALINGIPGFADTPPTIPLVSMAVTETVQVTPVNSINLAWTEVYYSPDPTGLAYLSGPGTLLISDSEVDQAPYTGTVNLFEITLSGVLTNTFTTPNFSNHPEPTGITYNPYNGHLFISDDRLRQVYELIPPGTDRPYFTPADIVTSFGTLPFNCGDPEGVAFDTRRGHLYIACAVDNKTLEGVFEVAPGLDGVFNGVPPTGDDEIVTYFDTAHLWLSGAEGIAYDPVYDSLYILGRKHAVEATREGTFIRSIRFSNMPLPVIALSDLTWAPASADPNQRHLYVVDRGLDVNDGKLYEVDLPRRPLPPLRITLPIIIK